MLDIKRIREDYEGVKKAVESRMQGDFGLERIPQLDERRRKVLAEVEAMKNKQNQDSKEIPRLKKEGKDASGLLAEMKELSEKIKVLDGEVSAMEEELRAVLLGIPNTPNPNVQVGKDDAENVELRRWGTPREFDFEQKAHWDVGQNLDILDKWLDLAIDATTQEEFEKGIKE